MRFSFRRRAKRSAAASYPPDFSPATIALCDVVRPYTMTSAERIAALRQAVEHVVRHEVPGDIVECGVWRGGSMMVVARTLQDLGVERRLHLFDTFEGMPPPEDVDRDMFGTSASDALARDDRDTGHVWARATLEDVRHNVGSTGYPTRLVSYVQGRVEETIPARAPERISLLRLDTDWYESTRHELEHLYPRLAPGGILIIDDYGHWEGARKAVDEYVSALDSPLFLSRIDYTGRLAVKPAA